MDINKRDRRGDAGAKRDVGQLTPRSGGRTAAERTRGDRTAPERIRTGRAPGVVREYPTRGSAALRPQESPEADRSAKPAVDEGRGGARLRVAPPPPVSVPRAPFVALILVLVVGGVLGILVINTKINENSFRLGKLQQEQAALDLREQQLEKQIADAEAPGSLAAQARKLGLVDSGPPAFIRLPDGRVIGVPRPAGGQPAITSQQAGG